MLTSKSPWKVGREWQECRHPSRECLSQVAKEQEPGQPQTGYPAMSGRDLLPHLCPILHLWVHSQPHLTTHGQRKEQRAVWCSGASLQTLCPLEYHYPNNHQAGRLRGQRGYATGPRANTQGRLTDLGTRHATASLKNHTQGFLKRTM